MSKKFTVPKNPGFFEYDRDNNIVDIFVRKDPECPFPFHKDDWYHQGLYFDEFVTRVKLFFKQNDLDYSLIKVV